MKIKLKSWDRDKGIIDISFGEVIKVYAICFIVFAVILAIAQMLMMVALSMLS